jgi:hypothetical protein
MPTMQETFDTVVAHLRQQGCKAITRMEGCFYRDELGRKCAAGCLIPDDKYTPDIERRACVEGSLAGTLVRSLGHDLILVRRLQIVHDDVGVEDWEAELLKVADKFNLTYTPPAPLASANL